MGLAIVSELIEVRRQGAVGWITLQRPKALNALTSGMIAALYRQLFAWRDDPSVNAIVLDSSSSPRAFCAGGDIRELWEASNSDVDRAMNFFATEYRMNATIASLRKPYIAL